MKIKFNQEVSLVVVDEYDEENDNIVSETNETFGKDEIHEVELIDSDTNLYCDIQFGDGSVAHGVQRKCFQIL